MKAAVKNLFIRDYNTPNPALPYFIQTIISSENINQDLIVKGEGEGGGGGENGPPNAMEFEMEVNPRTIPGFVGD
jgi:hypothetical protein